MPFGPNSRQQPLGLRPAARAFERRRRKLQVLENRHLLRQLGMLEGHRHAGSVQLFGVGPFDFLAGYANDRKVGRHRAGGNADEGRFSRAVFADDGMHLAAPEIDADGLEGFYRTIVLGGTHDTHDRGAE